MPNSYVHLGCPEAAGVREESVVKSSKETGEKGQNAYSLQSGSKSLRSVNSFLERALTVLST